MKKTNIHSTQQRGSSINTSKTSYAKPKNNSLNKSRLEAASQNQFMFPFSHKLGKYDVTAFEHAPSNITLEVTDVDRLINDINSLGKYKQPLDRSNPLYFAGIAGGCMFLIISFFVVLKLAGVSNEFSLFFMIGCGVLLSLFSIALMAYLHQNSQNFKKVRSSKLLKLQRGWNNMHNFINRGIEAQFSTDFSVLRVKCNSTQSMKSPSKLLSKVYEPQSTNHKRTREPIMTLEKIDIAAVKADGSQRDNGSTRRTFFVGGSDHSKGMQSDHSGTPDCDIKQLNSDQFDEEKLEQRSLENKSNSGRTKKTSKKMNEANKEIFRQEFEDADFEDDLEEEEKHESYQSPNKNDEIASPYFDSILNNDRKRFHKSNEKKIQTEKKLLDKYIEDEKRDEQEGRNIEEISEDADEEPKINKLESEHFEILQINNRKTSKNIQDEEELTKHEDNKIEDKGNGYDRECNEEILTFYKKN